MSDTYVLVHGAWHSGDVLEPVVDHLRAAGHACHCQTLAGNRPDGDHATTGLQDAVQSVVDYFEEHDLTEVRLVGHSYGGMVISKVADILPGRIPPLVYHNAFVPCDGQCLIDLVSRFYVETVDPIAEANDGAVMLPFPMWWEAFINDGDPQRAEASYRRLHPQPYRTFTDPIRMKTPLRRSRSEDPSSIFSRTSPCRTRTRGIRACGDARAVQAGRGMGSHEVCFSNPSLLAGRIEEAGRD
jgi:pimeloyl-ACP methyl ester carboxylesterase